MKKGIVMEQHRGFTIVMTDDGLFEKALRIENASIGFEVEYEPIIQKKWFAILKEKFFTMRIAALACILLIALLPLYMIASNNSTYAYVDIDINPSIELEINDNLEVTNILPFNEDAVLLIEKLGDVKGKDIEDVVDRIIVMSEETGLVNAEKNVLIGVHYVEKDTNKSVLDTIDNHFAEKDSDWEVITVKIPEEVRETAESDNVSMNKVLAKTVKEQSLENLDSIVTEEDTKVLQSFFNSNRKSKVEITTEDSLKETTKTPSAEKSGKLEPAKSSEQRSHPSELKGKNGEINSNKSGENHHNMNHPKKQNQQGKSESNGKNNNHYLKGNEKKQERNQYKDSSKNKRNNWDQEKQNNHQKNNSNGYRNEKSNDNNRKNHQHNNGQNGNGKHDD